MKLWTLPASVVIAAMLTFTLATDPNRQPVPYSLNIFFVPPIMSARCPLGQFWYPTTLACSMCFCLTGSLSRCVPQPGCNPNDVSSTTTESGAVVDGVTPASVITGANSTIASVTNPPVNSTAAPATVQPTITPVPALPVTNNNTTPTPAHNRVRRSRTPRFDMFNRED